MKVNLSDFGIKTPSDKFHGRSYNYRFMLEEEFYDAKGNKIIAPEDIKYADKKIVHLFDKGKYVGTYESREEANEAANERINPKKK